MQSSPHCLAHPCTGFGLNQERDGRVRHGVHGALVRAPRQNDEGGDSSGDAQEAHAGSEDQKGWFELTICSLLKEIHTRSMVYKKRLYNYSRFCEILL